jgi:hypothetical protein
MYHDFINALVNSINEVRVFNADAAFVSLSMKTKQELADRRAAAIERENAACAARQKVERGFELKAQRARSREIETELHANLVRSRGTRYEQLERQRRKEAFDGLFTPIGRTRRAGEE